MTFKTGRPANFHKLPLEDRIRIFTTKRANGCWEWNGTLSKSGYGILTHQRKTWRAHRLIWVLKHGPFKTGRLALHKCDNRKCIRLGHLFEGTNADNVADAVRKRRHAFGEATRHCKLTELQAKALLQAYVPYRVGVGVLGKRFGISSRQAAGVIYGTSWKHLDRSHLKFARRGVVS